MELPEDPLADVWMIDPPPRIDRPRIVRPVRIDPAGSRGPTAAQARGPRWRRTGRGLFVPATAALEQPAQRIAEAAGHLPRGGAVTGWASLHLALARWFEGLDGAGNELPVQLAIGPGNRRGHLPGIVVSRRPVDAEVVVRHGVRCLGVHRSLVDEMVRRGDLREAVAALEMVLHAELTSLVRFRAWLATTPRFVGKPLVERAVALAVEGAESPQEVHMRLIWEIDAGLPRPLCNRTLFSADGRFLARPDLLDVTAGVVGEYDGEDHLRTARRRRDVAREDELREHGLEYFSLVAGDRQDRPTAVRRMLRARERALRSRMPRRWTIERPDGRRTLTLEERIAAREWSRRR